MFISIVNINSGLLDERNMQIEMIYKRVSNFQRMSSINAYITSQRQKNIHELDVINNIKKTFEVDKDEAIRYFSNWQKRDTNGSG